MVVPPRPSNETQRLAALRAYELLDTPPEAAYDDLTALAAHLCGAPMAMISLVDQDRQWLKSSIGLTFQETPRDISFCGHAILQPHLFIVPDALADERFASNPLVVEEPRVRFYAGAPLVTPTGESLGTLCVMDRAARELTPAQEEGLRILGHQVMTQVELRRRTKELLESERRLLEVFRSCPAAFVIHRWSDRKIVDVNAAFTDLLGWEREEILGRTALEIGLIDEASAELLRERLRSEGAFRAVELEIRTRDGSRRSVLASTELADLRGEPHGLTTLIDITAREEAAKVSAEAAAALRDSEVRYRTLFDYAPDGILIADAESTYVDANPAICRMLGYTREEVLGMNASDIVVPEEVTHVEPALDTLNAGIDYHREWRFRRQDGSTFSADVIGTQMPDGRILAMLRDVTDRNRATEALRVAEERMRFALQSADVGIWDMDYSTGQLRWSERLEAHYGYSPGSFPGTFEAFVERIHPADRAGVVESIERAMKAGSDFAFEHRASWPDGTVRWLSGAGRVHLGPNGEPVRGLGISMDVTARHNLEAQYQQAQKMEAIGRLAGGVAHDFNNLLTAILGYCELMLGTLNPSDPLRADVTEIQRAGMSAAALTRQLLAFSRKQIIEPTLLDLNTVLQSMQAMVGRLLGEDIEVILRMAPEPSLVVADHAQMEQVLLNLAVNSRDAMPGGGTLRIETALVNLDEHFATAHFEVIPGPYIVLSVSDTGTGMAAEIQSHLFEPFFTTKEQGKGTGLGLATVHGIVTRAGGCVEVQSELGKGTAFRVYLPQASARDKAVEVPPTDAQVVRGTQTVLVVEDADGLRELTRRILQNQGHKVLVAASADEALGLSEKHPEIDVLLTDVVMPGLSGPQLAARILARRPELVVVYMSGYTEEAIVHRGVVGPGIVFVQKPFNSKTLGRKIQEALERRSRRAV